ncbi:RND efflux system, inner membrane transporter [Pseudomonas chlororaphis subsp. aureofaciens]|uniref:RND efflux system, inner membrane transporter n=1 Tax=Pseudomonas chlororaphis subsp. aureofaciens TaxID=587851 RepID=A0AAD0ZHU7_9PSED|nr:RND efflux system, inner membrane transporter [Pseudomonas chlororaphis subsp. aureofaciens]
MIGGTFVGTIMTLVFLPAMYSIWFKISHASQRQTETAELA